MVSTAAFHARVRGSVPGLGGLKETKLFLPHPRVKVSIVGSLRDREVACSASDRQGSNFDFCVWRAVSSQSSHHPQEVLLAQFSLYVHKSGLKPDSFHFFFKPSRCIKASFYISEEWLDILQLVVLERHISRNGFKHNTTFFFICHPLSSHFHPLQVANCGSNSRLVVDEDDNGKFRLEIKNKNIK